MGSYGTRGRLVVLSSRVEEWRVVMANHMTVKTRKHMKPEDITQILNDLNKSHFKGGLEFEYCEGGWGDHTWIFKYVGNDGKECGDRICWLNGKQHFEMRHGGGSHFMWWLDCTVCNELGVRFNGMLCDDGDGERRKGVPNKYPEFVAFLKMMCTGPVDRGEDFLRARMQMECEWGTPPEHTPDLGEKLDLEVVFTQFEAADD